MPGARFGVGLAVRALPTRRDRERYYSEFVAELYGQPASAQIRSMAGFLSQSLALRTALGPGPSRGIEEIPMPSTTAGQRFRCRYLHWHHWRTFSTPDGSRYSACSVCRKEHEGGEPGSANTIGA
jgi:hypothetical protein